VRNSVSAWAKRVFSGDISDHEVEYPEKNINLVCGLRLGVSTAGFRCPFDKAASQLSAAIQNKFLPDGIERELKNV